MKVDANRDGLDFDEFLYQTKIGQDGEQRVGGGLVGKMVWVMRWKTKKMGLEGKKIVKIYIL